MGSWLLLILLGMIWGGSFLGVEMALRDFGPITIAMVRVLLAAIILTIVAQLTGHHLPSISTAVGRRTWLHCFGMGLFSNACLLAASVGSAIGDHQFRGNLHGRSAVAGTTAQPFSDS